MTCITAYLYFSQITSAPTWLNLLTIRQQDILKQEPLSLITHALCVLNNHMHGLSVFHHPRRKCWKHAISVRSHYLDHTFFLLPGQLILFHAPCGNDELSSPTQGKTSYWAGWYLPWVEEWCGAPPLEPRCVVVRSVLVRFGAAHPHINDKYFRHPVPPAT